MKAEFRTQLKEWRTAWDACLKGWVMENGEPRRFNDEDTFTQWYEKVGYGGNPVEIEAAIKSCEKVGFYFFVSCLEEHETTPSERKNE